MLHQVALIHTTPRKIVLAGRGVMCTESGTSPPVGVAHAGRMSGVLAGQAQSGRSRSTHLSEPKIDYHKLARAFNLALGGAAYIIKLMDIFVARFLLSLTSTAFNGVDWAAIGSIFTAIGATGAAVSAWFSWRAIRQQVQLEQPLLVAGFSISADGKTSAVSVTNVGKRVATYVIVLVSTGTTYKWGQLPDVIRPGETIRSVSTSLAIDLKRVPLAEVVVSCVDSVGDMQLAWSMDGGITYKPRRRTQAPDIDEVFKLLYPGESLETKTLVSDPI